MAGGREFVRVNATADGANTVISGRSGEVIVVLGYSLTANAAGVVTLQDSTGTPVVFASFELLDSQPVAYAGGDSCPAFEVTAGKNFVISNAAGVDTLGHVTFRRRRTYA